MIQPRFLTRTTTGVVDVVSRTLLILVFCSLICGNQSGRSRRVDLQGDLQNRNPSEFRVIAAPEVIQRDNAVPDSIHGSLSTLCEKCSESQRKKVEQILLLLFNFNSQGGTGEDAAVKLLEKTEKNKFKKSSIKKKSSSTKHKKFKVTSVPRNSPPVPTPEITSGNRVIQFPTLSTTPSSFYSGVGVSILPFYPSTSSIPTLPFPASGISTTMSSALEPVQSVEMPTPPMPPTTTGPVYLYYLASAAAPTLSSSMQPPTTPVVESSVASKPTTVEP